ncbi:MAG: hypothetical protein ACR2NW_06200 [Thermodesulfobacteriota bacterium]
MKTICTLSKDEFSKRIDEINEKIIKKIISVEENETGFNFYFESSDELAKTVLNFIINERKCCKSLRFELGFEPDDGFLILKLSGPGGIKEIIYNSFNISQLNQN